MHGNNKMAKIKKKLTVAQKREKKKAKKEQQKKFIWVFRMESKRTKRLETIDGMETGCLYPRQCRSNFLALK